MDSEALLLQGDLRARSLVSCQGASTSWHTCPRLWPLPSSSLFLLRTAPPWAPLVECVRWSGTPACASMLPRASLCKQQCWPPRLCQGSPCPASGAARPPAVVPGVSGGGKQKPALSFSGCQASEQFVPQPRNGDSLLLPVPSPFQRRGYLLPPSWLPIQF